MFETYRKYINIFVCNFWLVLFQFLYCLDVLKLYLFDLVYNLKLRLICCIYTCFIREYFYYIYLQVFTLNIYLFVNILSMFIYECDSFARSICECRTFHHYYKIIIRNYYQYIIIYKLTTINWFFFKHIINVVSINVIVTF